MPLDRTTLASSKGITKDTAAFPRLPLARDQLIARLAAWNEAMDGFYPRGVSKAMLCSITDAGCRADNATLLSRALLPPSAPGLERAHAKLLALVRAHFRNHPDRLNRLVEARFLTPEAASALCVRAG